MRLLGEVEYLTILNSECCLGSIRPGPARPGRWPAFRLARARVYS